MKKQVATFTAGSFATISEGLWRDDKGNYFVGGEMPLPIERVKEMDVAGELEWLAGESEAATEREAHEKPQNKLETLESTEAETTADKTSDGATGSKASIPSQAVAASQKQKKPVWLWVVPVVVVVAVGAVVAFLLLTSPETQEQIAEIPAVTEEVTTPAEQEAAEETQVDTQLSNEAEIDLTFDFPLTEWTQFSNPVYGTIFEVGKIAEEEGFEFHAGLLFESPTDFLIVFADNPTGQFAGFFLGEGMIVGSGEMMGNEDKVVFSYIFDYNFYEGLYENFEAKLANGEVYSFLMSPSMEGTAMLELTRNNHTVDFFVSLSGDFTQ